VMAAHDLRELTVMAPRLPASCSSRALVFSCCTSMAACACFAARTTTDGLLLESCACLINRPFSALQPQRAAMPRKCHGRTAVPCRVAAVNTSGCERHSTMLLELHHAQHPAANTPGLRACRRETDSRPLAGVLRPAGGSVGRAASAGADGLIAEVWCSDRGLSSSASSPKGSSSSCMCSEKCGVSSYVCKHHSAMSLTVGTSESTVARC